MDDLGEQTDVAPWQQRSFDGVLDRRAFDVDRVDPEQAVADRGAHEIPEQPIDLGHRVPVEIGTDELTVPRSYIARPDRRKLDIAKAGEDVPLIAIQLILRTDSSRANEGNRTPVFSLGSCASPTRREAAYLCLPSEVAEIGRAGVAAGGHR